MKPVTGAPAFDEEISVASEQRRREWMRRRLLIYCLVSMGLAGIELVLHLVGIALAEGPLAGNLMARSGYDLLPGLITILVFSGGYYRARSRSLDRAAIFRYSFWMILVIGAIVFLIRPVFATFPLRALLGDTPLTPPHRQPSFVGRVLMVHLAGALFIPWTVREALRVLLALCGLAIVSDVLFVDASFAERLGAAFVLPTAGVPGLLYCWLRYSRFRSRFTIEHLIGRYGQLQRELQQARRIHEMLFPNEIREGPFQLRYRYEPMQQLGGDYVYVHRDEGRCLNIVVLDVTGHGITAALTVNRIHGELDRLFGERADRRPGDVLTALNRYFCVTMSRHGVYATAVALRIDQQGDELQWANAGHPPPFVVQRQGGCLALESHAVMLGVLDEPAYECSTQTLPFADGDRVVLYTDGVVEAHDGRYEMLGIEGFERMLCEKAVSDVGDGISEELLREVQRFRHGPAEDDILIVELTREKGPEGM